MKFIFKWRILLILCFLGINITCKAQFTYGTTGLLNMPTAEMQRDKTFMFGGGFLERHATPARWFYDTYNYYVNITFFPWMEIAYTCTLHKAFENDPFLADGYWVPSTYGKFVNQDRNFSVRFRLWKEGWWKKWTPQIVLGGNDVLNNSWADGNKFEMSSKKGNGFYSRYYIVATKYLDMRAVGRLGIHAAYLYNKREDYHYNGPAVGMNLRLGLSNDSFFTEFLNHLNLMAEYDSKTVNIGVNCSFWKDYINAVVEFNQCKYVSTGLVFKIHLK